MVGGSAPNHIIYCVISLTCFILYNLCIIDRRIQSRIDYFAASFFSKLEPYGHNFFQICSIIIHTFALTIKYHRPYIYNTEPYGHQLHFTYPNLSLTYLHFGLVRVLWCYITAFQFILNLCLFVAQCRSNLLLLQQ